MKKERDEKKEREARILKRQQLKTLSQSLVARRRWANTWATRMTR